MKKNLYESTGRPDLEALEARLALRLTAGLTELQASRPTPDIDARLRFARERALARAAELRRAEPAMTASAAAREASGLVFSGGAGAGKGPQGRHPTPWWLRLAALAPIVVLIAGLTLIQQRNVRVQIETAAEIDAALLVDDLPPAAYADPGFVEFLRSSQE